MKKVFITRFESLFHSVYFAECYRSEHTKKYFFFLTLQMELRNVGILPQHYTAS
jgi:hypothetical protein